MRQQARAVPDNFIEIQKKFLITNIDVSRLPEHRETVIQQTFLRSSEINLDLDRHIRAESCRGEIRYYLMEKYLTSRPAIGFERKEEIGKRHFERLRNLGDPERKPVIKRRWEFVWNAQRFRIDKYDDPSEGLLILEAVLRRENEDAPIPAFCTVVREVTGEDGYYWPRAEDPEKRPSTAAAAIKKTAYLGPVLRKSYFGHEDDFRYVVKTACRAIQRYRNLQRDEKLSERVTRVEEYFRSQGCWEER